MKNVRQVGIYVFVFKKLQRERSYFCPRLFREGGGRERDLMPSRGCRSSCCSSLGLKTVVKNVLNTYFTTVFKTVVKNVLEKKYRGFM